MKNPGIDPAYLIAVTNEFVVARFTNLAHHLGIEAMSAAVQETAELQTAFSLMSPEEQVQELQLIIAGEAPVSTAERIFTAQGDYTRKVSRAMGDCGVYRLQTVEPNYISLSALTINKRDVTSTSLRAQTEDNKVQFRKQAMLAIDESPNIVEVPTSITREDIAALAMALERLTAFTQNPA